MSHVTFNSDYDHRWPSGAITAFKKGMSLRVRAEVSIAAIAAKKATADEKSDTQSDNEQIGQATHSGRDQPLADEDVHLSTGPDVRDQRLSPPGER